MTSRKNIDGDSSKTNNPHNDRNVRRSSTSSFNVKSFSKMKTSKMKEKEGSMYNFENLDDQ